MTIRAVLTCFLAFFISVAAVAAATAAGADPARHALSVPMLEKLKAATEDLKKNVPEKDGEDSGDHETVEELAKALDARPGVKPVLARHGFTSQSYALTVLAVFQAGMYLGMEPSMDKKKAAALLASYPKETQANIELLRKNPKLLK
jgi:hypothetical protein